MFFDTKHLKTNEIFLKLEKTIEAIPEKRLVSYYKFKICLVSNETVVGECNFRIGNTEKIFFGGNIGYEIYEQYRGNYYAGKACLLLFELAKMHKMDYLYITCNPDNYASRKTCEYAGGKLEAILNLPTDTDMYEKGERKKCIYYFSFENENTES
jgi:tagatose 1,6-diphosphate aldolase